MLRLVINTQFDFPPNVYAHYIYEDSRQMYADNLETVLSVQLNIPDLCGTFVQGEASRCREHSRRRDAPLWSISLPYVECHLKQREEKFTDVSKHIGQS